MLVQNQTFEVSQGDLNAIQQTALDYIEGWYDCNADRAIKALHPELVKRSINNNIIRGLNTHDMLNFIQAGQGSKFNKDRQIAITVLDVFKDIATVKIESAEYNDYAHLGKINGRWVIINILWGFKNS